MQIFHDPDQCRSALGASVATIGKYDGMHLGHQRILDRVLALGRAAQLPTVVLLSEPQPEEFFNPAGAPPRLCPFEDKVEFLAGYGIDAVLRMAFNQTLSQLSAENFAGDYLGHRLGLRALVVGDDFHFGRQRLGDIQLLRRTGAEQGYEVESVAGLLLGEERVSSTLVRDYLRRGDCARAAALLGRPFSMSGEVVAGRQLGRKLGMPTANIALAADTALPLGGIFVVSADWGEGLRPGVASLGIRPTVSNDQMPVLEVHLLDFGADIYGKRLRVNFLHKLRDEAKFETLDDLQRAMANDLCDTRAYFAAHSLTGAHTLQDSSASKNEPAPNGEFPAKGERA